MVNRRRNYTLHLLLFSVLMLLALAAFNYLGMEYRARLDLTADKRFTLSEGTRTILEKLPDNISLTYYVSSEPPDKRVNLERDVREKLEELSKASNGKLAYVVERVDQKNIAAKLEELSKFGVVLAQDYQTTDVADKSAAIGVNQFLSSVLVRYGPGEPQAINGVINVVDPKSDEAQPHRVETLEFDIMYTVMKLKSKQRKPALKQMMRNLSQPLNVRYFFSEQMPRANPKIGETIAKALDQLRTWGGDKVKLSTQSIAWGEQVFAGGGRPVPHVSTPEPTVDPKDAAEPPVPVPGDPRTPNDRDGDGTADSTPGTAPAEGTDPKKLPGGVTPPGGEEAPKPDKPVKPEARKGPNFYYTVIVIDMPDGRQDVLYNFNDDRNVDAVLTRIEDRLWELVKPRATLGVIAPDAGGRSPYSELIGFMFGELGYSGRQLNLRQDKRIPPDLAALIVFEPNSLSERELYEIDRFLAQGGNVVFLYQGYSATMSIARFDSGSIILNPIAPQAHFTQWCKRLGISFESELLVQKGGYELKVVRSGGRSEQQLPVSIPLAANVGPADLDQTSVFARGLPGFALPFPVELKLDDEKLKAANLTRQDVIALSGQVFRFIPENRDMPSIPRMGLSLEGGPGTELNAEATPGADTRLQRLGRAPLICSTLSGTFTSAWEGKDKLVPTWEGGASDPTDLGGQAVPEIKHKPGRLMVVSCAASFNSQYFSSWQREDLWASNNAYGPVLRGGLQFYQNIADAGVYGDELVGLRAKTGAAPRIRADYTRGERITWYVLTLAGAPAMLLMLGFLRGALRAKAREEYRLKLENNAV